MWINLITLIIVVTITATTHLSSHSSFRLCSEFMFSINGLLFITPHSTLPFERLNVVPFFLYSILYSVIKFSVFIWFQCIYKMFWFILLQKHDWNRFKRCNNNQQWNMWYHWKSFVPALNYGKVAFLLESFLWYLFFRFRCKFRFKSYSFDFIFLKFLCHLWFKKSCIHFVCFNLICF